MTWRAAAAVVVAAVLVAVVLAMAARRRRPERFDDVVRRLPTVVGDLGSSGADEIYPAASIYSYLDGGAEVYLAYNLRTCLARRYAGPAGELVVDLFDMGASADAFGVFSRDLDGVAVAIGQGARLRPGWLSAWKGPFFISITADRDDAAARDALLALGRAVTAAIRGEGPRPALLDRLPRQGLDAARVAYAHDHVTLASHVTLPDGNPLRLDGRTEVAVGRYGHGAAAPALLVVLHVDEGHARAGTEALAHAWGGAAGEPARDPDGRFRWVARRGRFVAVALGFADAGTARDRIGEALAALGGV